MNYLRRFVWYLSTRLMALTVVLSILIVGFYYAMNVANMQVVLTDGMAKRARVVMMDESPDELVKFFLPTFLERDEALLIERDGSSPYKDYNINGIDHRLSMSWMWCWPWEDRARADITETIPKIDGHIKSNLRAAALEAGGEERLYPPRWRSAKYRATLVKQDGQWLIQGLQLLEVLD